MKDIAFICNEPTPYRLHLLKRLVDEQPQLRVHTIFTHTYRNARIPWQMDLSQIPRTVFFEQEAMGQKKTLIPSWALANQITGYLQSRNIQMVVLNGYADINRMLIICWGKKHGIPVLLRGDSNVHGLKRGSWLRRWIKPIILRWTSRRLAGLMPMGRCGQAFFDEMMGKHNLPTFLCPYEPDYKRIRDCSVRQQSAFIQQFKLDPERKRLLYCGRLVGIKKVDLIIQAFERISRKRPQWDLTIAGLGPLEHELKDMVSPQLKERVQFLGFLQFDQTVACYQVSDVLVHPPEYEPWALVINEAVAAGLPIIATDIVGAANELIEPGVNGLLIKPNDVDALADAMLQITDGDTAQQMGAKAGEVLQRWQQKADPVQAIVDAAAHFA